MNKKPVLVRTIVAIFVLVVFLISMMPLTERDFYETFRGVWNNPSDPVLIRVTELAQKLQEESPDKYQFPSEALEEAARRMDVDMSGMVKGKDLADNRDVIAEVRKLAGASIRRGLDLNGGVEFLMRIIPDEEFSKRMAEAGSDAERKKLQEDFDTSRDRAIEVLRTRLESKKIFEVEMYPMGDDMISLRIPVVSKDEKARLLNMIKMSAQLRFHLVHEQNDRLVAELERNPGFEEPGYMPLTDDKGRVFFVEKRAAMTGDGIVFASPTTDEFGQRKIILRFNADGAADFGNVTQNNVGRLLAVVLDGKLYCAPQLKTAILNGSAEITGSFSIDELKDISDALIAGGMKYRLTDEAVFDTDPQLGQDNIRAGVIAGIASIIVVILFLVVYYRWGGVIVALALCFNVILLLGFMAAFSQTLTMPGIAGIILTIGMAVDINVLIFERIREEQRTGKPLSSAIDAGYGRVWPVVLDSNLTGFFTAIILLYFGTGAIKGFAITFAIGIVSSMFTGVFMTHLWLDYLVRFFNVSKLRMMELIPADNHVNYMRYWRQMMAVSALLIVTTFAIFAIERGKTLAIDFTGGTMVSMSYVEKVDTNRISETLKKNGFGDSRITYKKTAGDSGQIEIIIREDSGAGSEEADLVGNSLGKRIERVLSAAYPQAGFSGGQESVVSGLVGWEFSKSAMLAVVMAFIIIAAYISLRYEFAYAMAGLVALMHDVIISTGIFLLLGREISLNVIAALLTIIGYSINDTIVVFDRIRENLGLRKDLNYFQIINLSLNQTMARTLLTSFSTFLVLVVLLVAGGIAVNDFVLVMLLGVLVGTYSSVFIASPLVALWHRRKTGVKEGTMLSGAITAEDVKALPAEKQ